MAKNGLITTASLYPAAESIDRLEGALREKGVAIFARIDHGAGAKSAGMELRPTIVLIFGHPKGGTPLMQAAQTAAIDLPLKILAWQDADGKNWLSYNGPAWIAQRHGAQADATVQALTALLEKLVTSAAGNLS